MTRKRINPWETPTPPARNPWDDGDGHYAAFTNEGEAYAPIEAGRLDSLDFLSAMRENRRNTWVLFSVMLFLAAGFGYVLGWAWDLTFGGTVSAGMQHMTGNAIDWRRIILTPSDTGIKLGLSFLAGMFVWSLISLWRADKMVLRMADAQEVSSSAMPQLHNIVEEMAIAAGLPKPNIVLMPTEVPNAFAAGLRAEKATIGVTKGLLQQLNRRELQGVVAHEMAHIRNGDMRYATILAVMTGVLVFIAQLVMNMRYLAYAGNGRDRNRHPFMFIILIVVFMLTAILVPLIARLIQMAMSRQREYLADATAVQLTRDPGGLIGALEKISALQTPSTNLNQALEPLFIITPVKMLQKGNMAWFSTHPPLQNRIQRLKQLE